MQPKLNLFFSVTNTSSHGIEIYDQIRDSFHDLMHEEDTYLDFTDLADTRGLAYIHYHGIIRKVKRALKNACNL